MDHLGQGDRDLADLLAAAEPYQADPFRKRRVLVRVLGQNGSGQRMVRWPRLVTAGVLITATAGAAVGSGLPQKVSELFSDEQSSSVAPVTEVKNDEASASERVPAPAEVEPAPPAPGAEQASPPAAAPALKSQEKTRPSRSSEASTRDAEDAAPVLDAIRALRKERDPVRAERLLGDYMKSHPNGVLSEDALALSIEAAAARKDPRAAEYARRYLARYPQGKYRNVAQRALEQSR